MDNTKIVARPWQPQDLIDDLQGIIDEECDNYLNTRRTTLCMARDYLKEHFAETKWISVKDRLPEFSEEEMERYRFFGDMFFPEFNVMILGATQATTLYFDGERWYDEECHCYCVTHWQPMPQPPKGE